VIAARKTVLKFDKASGSFEVVREGNGFLEVGQAGQRDRSSTLIIANSCAHHAEQATDHTDKSHMAEYASISPAEGHERFNACPVRLHEM
jgi:hypothetical protein